MRDLWRASNQKRNKMQTDNHKTKTAQMNNLRAAIPPFTVG
jgi:hypothetical protein